MDSEISSMSMCRIVSAWRSSQIWGDKENVVSGWQSHVSTCRFFSAATLDNNNIIPNRDQERKRGWNCSSLTSTFTRLEGLTRFDPRRTSVRLLKINTRRRRASHYKTRRRNLRVLSAGTFRPGDYRRRWYRVKGVFALTAFFTDRSHVLKRDGRAPRQERKRIQSRLVHLIFK